MNRARKAKRAAKKHAPALASSARHASTLEALDRRLARACDLLGCLDYCQDAELNVGALAIATRDLLDTVRNDLGRIRAAIRKSVRS